LLSAGSNMRRLQTRGPKEGKCNICGSFGPLTEDHVPPKKVIKFPRMSLYKLVDGLDIQNVENPNESFSNKLRIYYWCYPFWDQVAIRIFGVVFDFGSPSLMVSVLKYMPIAFMAVWDKNPKIEINQYCLNDFMMGSGTQEVDLPLDFRNIPSQIFPETPIDRGITLHGQDSFYARRKVD